MKPEYVCDDCERPFESKGALAIHNTRIHDKRSKPLEGLE